VTLQEHWHLPQGLGLLTQLYYGFMPPSRSAIDIPKNILAGRPNGGTAILFKNELAGNAVVRYLF
jgi:hypothetical protein